MAARNEESTGGWNFPVVFPELNFLEAHQGLFEMDNTETTKEFLARQDEQQASRARQQFSDEVERLKRTEESRTTAPVAVEVVYMNPPSKPDRRRGW